MAKYVYPAVFSCEEDGAYAVDFPDLPGCYTSGSDLPDALEMAQDALALMLYHMEEEGRAIPSASNILTLPPQKNAFASYVACDTKIYRRTHHTRAVKKTLSIPEWMNEEAENAGINFSQTLQDALKEKLGYA